MNRRQFFRRSLQTLGVSDPLPGKGAKDSDYLDGRKAMRRGEQKEALVLLNRAAANHPEDADCQRALGQCLYRLQRWAEARATFEQARNLDAEAQDLILHIGLTMAREERLDEAMACWAEFNDPSAVLIRREINLDSALMDAGHPPSGEEAAQGMEEAMKGCGLF
ncbi:MAG: tetratricopeptide repeat protein [Deltaproteobacteria bacterium]|nr:tetratricopeptide repeat protein [Deltaproteobacteria bacterium]